MVTAAASHVSKVSKGDLVAGRYRLLRPIGAGAMGTVWAARHELLGRDFALKLATISKRAGPETRARFLREAQIVGKLRHPNVVDVADVGAVDAGAGAGLYLAMELLEGQSVAERLTEHGPLETPEALAITSEVCRGLGAAHAAGVVHRDIKPENIFLARGPTGGIVPKLLDFGISKGGEGGEALITLTGQLFGTPAYMSPEQALGEIDVDHRTDIWSLGVVLYEMLTGCRPFDADSYPALLLIIAEKDFTPLPPSIPLEVQALIARCLAKSREDRYPTADALRAALDAARGSPAGASVRPGKVERSRSLPSFRPRAPEARGRAEPRRRMILGGGIALAVAVGGVAWWSYHAMTAASTPPVPVAAVSGAPAASPAPTVSSAPSPPEAAAVSAPLPSAAPPTRSAPLPSSTALSAGSRPKAPAGGRSVTKVNSAGF